MQNKKFKMSPVALTTTLTTNLLNAPTTTGGVNGGSSPQYIILYQIHIANKTASNATFSLWLGATGGNAAGTEIEIGKTVLANDHIDLFFPAGLRMESTDFLVGGAGTTTALTISAFGEIGVAG